MRIFYFYFYFLPRSLITKQPTREGLRALTLGDFPSLSIHLQRRCFCCFGETVEIKLFSQCFRKNYTSPHLCQLFRSSFYIILISCCTLLFFHDACLFTTNSLKTTQVNSDPQFSDSNICYITSFISLCFLICPIVTKGGKANSFKFTASCF